MGGPLLRRALRGFDVHANLDLRRRHRGLPGPAWSLHLLQEARGELGQLGRLAHRHLRPQRRADRHRPTRACQGVGAGVAGFFESCVRSCLNLQPRPPFALSNGHFFPR